LNNYLIIFLYFLSFQVTISQNKPVQNINELTPPDVKYEIYPKPFQQKVYYGIKAGPYVLFPTDQYGLINSSSRIYNFQVGTLLNFKVSENFSFRHELNPTFEVLNVSKINSRKFFVELPWHFNFHYDNQNFIFCGLKTQLVFLKSKNNLSEDPQKNLRSDLDFALTFGFGYIWEDDWHILLRTSQSFNKLIKIENYDFNAIQISLAYLLQKRSAEDKKLMHIRKKRI